MILVANVSLTDTELTAPLPYNAVLAQYVYASPIPDNKATAQAANVLATAEAQTTGTPTQLPWNAVVITRVPTRCAKRLRPGSGSATGERKKQHQQQRLIQHRRRKHKLLT